MSTRTFLPTTKRVRLVAAAAVLGGSAMVAATVQPAAAAPLPRAAASSTITPNGSGCPTVAAGPGVYNSTAVEYMNHIDILADGSGQPYYWYVKRTDGTMVDHGFADGDIGLNEPANYYYVQLYNAGSAVHSWIVCWSG